MSDCPVCCGMEGYTLHTCGQASEADMNLSDAIGLEIERRERPFHVSIIAAGEILAETIGPGAARAVPLNEAAERLNDALAMQARIEAAIEVYAGMEGFIPETAAEGYCLRIIDEMNKALQEANHE